MNCKKKRKKTNDKEKLYFITTLNVNIVKIVKEKFNIHCNYCTKCYKVVA